MSTDAVAAIAKAATASAGLPFGLMNPQVRLVEGRLLWRVDSPTIGSGWRIEIDDATGLPGPIERWGIR